MKKVLFVILVLFVTALTVYAQETVGEPNPASIGADSAQQMLQTVSVDKFESAGFWNVSISSDEGIANGRLFPGSPAGKDNEPTPEERYKGSDPKISDDHAYGAKVDFFRRGNNTIYITAQKPIPVEGIAKTLSVWVAGRNFNHTLKIVLSDYFNNKFELVVGKLNFQGWKKLSVAIPPQSADGKSGIIQRNFHYNTEMGLKIIGFKIECDMMEAYGSYYVYFDDLRAVTDIFAEDNRDKDDMIDNW